MAEMAEGVLLSFRKVFVIPGAAATDVNRIGIGPCCACSRDALIATSLDTSVTADDVVIANSSPAAEAVHLIDLARTWIKDAESLVVRGTRVNDNAVHFPLWLCSGAGHLLVQTRRANALSLQPGAHRGAKPVQQVDKRDRFLPQKLGNLFIMDPFA